MKKQSLRVRALVALVIAIVSPVVPGFAETAQPPAPSPDKLLDLSLEELTKIDVTIASRGAEQLNRTAAAVSVVTQEQIRRSGATSIPEALRLVPGLTVARISANQWAISCRFPTGRFSNKLLVLIDGRTVYNPIFSGTFWDQQDTLLEDVDRIEVIRGSGAAPWGSNAVTGVIHVITKSARDTKKVLATAAVGTEDQLIAGVRHGWAVNGGAARVFAKGTKRDSFKFVDGTDARDDWDTIRGGFRVDRTVAPGRELTVIGNAYSNDESTTQLFILPAFPFQQTSVVPEDASGASLSGKLSGTRSRVGDWSLQIFADRAKKDEALLLSSVSTLDAEYQRRLPRDHRELLFGFNYRIIEDRIENDSPSVRFNPDRRQTYIAAGFAQHKWTGRDDSWNVTAAVRAEVNHFTGLEWQPSLRGAWFPGTRGMLWGALSRAVRLPSRGSEDLSAVVLASPPGALGPGSPTVITRFDGIEHEAETVVDAELGGRLLITDTMHADAVVFRGRYPNLVKGVPSGPPTFVPGAVPALLNVVQPRNIGRATSSGAELTLQYTPRKDLRFTAGYAHAAFTVNPDFGSLDTEGAGRLPKDSAHLRSEWDFAKGWELDTVTYYAGKLPGLFVDRWFRTDVHLSHLTPDGTRLELVGQNLLDSNHLEFGVEQVGSPAPELIPRAFYARVSRSF